MNQMEWPSLEELTAWAPMPAGYAYKMPAREDIPQLVAAIETWYPDIAIGAARGDIGVRPQYRRYFGLQPHKNGRKQLLNY